MYILFWLFYYILPGVAAWKLRSADFAKCVYGFFGTAFAVYLAVWSENMLHKTIDPLIRNTDVKSWLTVISLVLIWFFATIIFHFAVTKLAPDGFELFEFPEHICKFLGPLTVFLHCGLICAMIFTIFSVSPFARHVNIVSLEPSLCSGARYRILWDSFFIDRFSWQEAGINARRRSFDRFVPEKPEQVLKALEEAKRKKAEAEAAARAAELAARKAAHEKALAEAKAREEAEKKERILKKKKRLGKIIIYQEQSPGGPVVAVDQTPEATDEEEQPVKKKKKKKKKSRKKTHSAEAPDTSVPHQENGEPTGIMTTEAQRRFNNMSDNKLKKQLGKMIFSAQENQKNALSAAQ